MASSYTSNIRLVLPVQGELAGTWGDTVNSGLTNLTDSAIAGLATVSVTTANQALTIASGAADQARMAFLKLTTTTTANFAVYAPPVTKGYVVNNTTAYTATVYNSTVAGNTTAAGTGVAIPAGKTVTIYSDGTNFLSKADYFPALRAGALDTTPIGSTTPSTGAFTTLSATRSGAGDAAVFTNNGGSAKTLYVYTDAVNSGITDTANGGANFSGVLFDPVAHTALVVASGAVRGTFSSTGLAVTGALSATGAASFPGTGTGAAGVTWIGSNGSNTIINSPSGQGVVFYQNNATALATLDAAGNLGLGVTPSAWNTFKAFQVGSLTSLSDVGYASNTYYATGYKYIANDYASRYQQTLGQHIWYTAPSGTAGNAITFTQAMTLDASGNRALGTATQSTYRDLIQGIDATASNYALVVRNSTPTNLFYVRNDGYMGFGVSATALTLDTSGNFMIGKTNAGSSNQGSYFTNAGFWSSAVAGTGSNTHASFVNNASVTPATVGAITSSGSTTTYATTSDYRLKTVIAPITDAGSRIDALQPIEFEWNLDGSRTRGFLAHQFQEVYAQSVNGTKDAVDVDGNPVYQSMQAGSSEVIADLVAEIQSLRARIAALEVA